MEAPDRVLYMGYIEVRHLNCVFILKRVVWYRTVWHLTVFKQKWCTYVKLNCLK